MSNFLEQNIFYQKSKSKYNPDVNLKKNIIEKERNINLFKKNDIIYNSITNIVPTNIKTFKDLELQKDLPINNIDKLIAEKNKERQNLELELNNNKQKFTINEPVVEKIQNYNELKNIQSNFLKKQNIEIQDNKNRYEDIMNDLKYLGIINNNYK